MSVRRDRRTDPKTGKVRRYWIVDVDMELPNGQRKRVKRVSPVQSRRGAETFERELRASLVAGTWGKEKEPVPTVEEFAPEYMTNHATLHNKPSSLSAKQAILKNHILPVFGSKRLDQITKREIAAFTAKQRKPGARLRDRNKPKAEVTAGYSKKAVNNHLAVLSGLLTMAVEWDLIPTKPPVKFFRREPTDYDFLSFEEAEQLVAKADPETWRPMIIVALNTGLRMGELMGLQWGDVEFFSRNLVVRRNKWKGELVTPKSGLKRDVPMNSKVVAALKAHQHLRGPFVFCQEDGKPLTEQISRKALMRICRRAGIRHIGWHTLRHTFASHLAMRGVSMKAVQELLGHQGMEMTLRYSHLSPDVRHDAVEALIGEPTNSRPHDGHTVVLKKKGEEG